MNADSIELDVEVMVVGAGISGLTTTLLLQDGKKEVLLLESLGGPGGLVRCSTEQGSLFHRVGGHVFNSKDDEVSGWFWGKFNRENEFKKATRNAVILLNGGIIGYPIENHIYQLDRDLQKKIFSELLRLYSDLESTKAPKNFYEFLLQTFGQALCELYFFPYNEKIWHKALKDIPLEWLNGKLPMPEILQIVLSNIGRSEEANMVHSTFYYPLRGGSQFIVDRLAQGVEKVNFNSPVDRIDFYDGKILLNKKFRADALFWTGHVKSLMSLLNDNPELQDLICQIKNLESNGTSNVLCECDKTDYSWMYLPNSDLRAHRIIFTGNFSAHNNSALLPQNRSTCVVEFSGHVTEEMAREDCKLLPFSMAPISYNFEPNSYIIHSKSTRKLMAELKNRLKQKNIFLVGRFAEWEYFNMDAAIKSAMVEVSQFLTK